MSEEGFELLVAVCAMIVIFFICALALNACPPKTCKEAVERCAITEGLFCDDVERRCEERKP